MDFYLTAILQGLCFCGLAFGIFLTVKIFNIPDITTDGSYTLGGMVAAVMLGHSYSQWVLFPALLCCGALAGIVTGLIHTKLKINALLAGILTMTALYSINLLIAGRSNIPLLGNNSVFSSIPIFQDANLNALVILLLILIVGTAAMQYLLKTDFGLVMRATGNNENMVAAMGVNTDRIKIIGLAIANALTALSGGLVTQLQSFADINMGIGIVIVGLGSVMIAENAAAAFKSKTVSSQLLWVAAGTIVFRLILAFVLSMGIDAILLKMVTAVLVLLIVSVPKLTFKRQYD